MLLVGVVWNELRARLFGGLMIAIVTRSSIPQMDRGDENKYGGKGTYRHDDLYFNRGSCNHFHLDLSYPSSRPELIRTGKGYTLCTWNTERILLFI
jgi:hypothetical protein